MPKQAYKDANETTEMWKDIRKDQQERRNARLPGRQAEIMGLSSNGYTVKQLTEYQFRVNGKIDLYPIHKRYHVLSTERRGTYRNCLEFVRSILK